MERETRILIGLIIIFLAFISMSISIYSTGQDLSCDQCMVEFSSKTDAGIVRSEFELAAVELYDELVNRDNCKVGWDKVAGYLLR